MRKILFYFVVLVVNCLNAQAVDTIYYDIDWNPITGRNGAEFYRTIEFNRVDQIYQVTDYFIAGQEQMIGGYSDVNLEKEVGLFKWFFESGNLEQIRQYTEEGLRDGAWKTYNENGELVLESYYNKGLLLQSTDTNDIVFTIVENMPYLKRCKGDSRKELVGCTFDILKEHPKLLDIASPAKELNIENGKILIEFIVSPKGDAEDFIVIKGINPELDRLALEHMQKLQGWIPGSQDGEFVKVRFVGLFKFE